MRHATWLVVLVGLVIAPGVHARRVAPPPAEPKTKVQITRVVAHQTTSLDKQSLRRKIASAYLGGVRRCYVRALAQKPDAAGALTIQFTVNAVGRATAARVRGFDAAVARCVTGQVGRWRFPIPLKFAEPTTAKFTVGVQLEVVPPEPPPEPPADPDPGL